MEMMLTWSFATRNLEQKNVVVTMQSRERLEQRDVRLNDELSLTDFYCFQ